MAGDAAPSQLNPPQTISATTNFIPASSQKGRLAAREGALKLQTVCGGQVMLTGS